MDSSFWFDTIDFEMDHCIYRGVTGYNFQIEFFFLEIVFVLAKSVGPDEIHYVAFYLGLQCLSKCAFKRH